jgi:C-terminal processing protease CtpA/Prc
MRVMHSLSLVVALASSPAFVGCEEEPPLKAFPEHYAGVGLELHVEAAGTRVVRVLDGGPAALAGVQVDDVVLAVGGKPTRGMDLAAVVRELRGAPGSRVELEVRSAEGQRTVSLERRVLERKAGAASSGEGYQTPK